MSKIQKLCVLNAGDKVRHYSIASGEGSIAQDSGELLTDLKTFPVCSQYTDLASKTLYVRVAAKGEVSDWLPISGGGMEQYRLTITSGRDAHFVAPDGSTMTFEDVKAAVLDASKFVFLDYANAYHIPCFVVDTEGNEAVGFTSTFSVDGKPHVERVAINQQGVINTHNYAIVVYGNNGSVTIGEDCTASGSNSFAEGYGTVAEGNCSHAEGSATSTDGEFSHAEGSSTTASGDYSHAEGSSTTASNSGSHAEGLLTSASGDASHAEGYDTEASGDYTHAEGYGTVAEGNCSHAEGNNTYTQSYYQHAQGQYNNADDFDGSYGAFMHGCGTADDDRKNAFAIAEDGKVYVIGLGGYDGTNHREALSLQELLGTSNIQASANTLVNNYQVPQLTVVQVTQAYNAVVAGRSVTITDATGNYHLGVTQADVLNGDIAISLIYLNVMLLTYEVSGSTVDIQFKNL